MTSYINIKKLKRLALVLGNQLFPIEQQKIDKDATIFMCEDYGLCTYEKHHKSKIALFYMAMRSYRDQLEKMGYKVEYVDCYQEFKTSYVKKLENLIKNGGYTEIIFYEIEDKNFEQEIFHLIQRLNISFKVMNSQMIKLKF